MDIQLDQPEWTLESPIMTQKLSCILQIELLTMRGETMRVARHMSIAVPNDRDSLPSSPTLRDLVMLAIKRLHPAMQYIAELNGIRVWYHEQWALHQVWGCIEFGPDGVAKRIVP
ncbi:hypothetical protein [Spirosoma endbachense]|uniref:Uncharacterized protein n=1 Tax=Spirosoma endbachense TaxID=2666025 RepID=A0A6P1W5N9_9BACT|nr:hypothetical protein [Spirosoma endbachense]QHV99250.1 hypothetical protein GJR95_31425 [Spirosoma endbachense]